MDVCRKWIFFGLLLQIAATGVIGNQVTRIDLNIGENTVQHRTDKYQQNFDRYLIRPSIVLRRGLPLNVNVYFQKPFDELKDQVRFELSTGLVPQIDKGTLIYAPLERQPSNSTAYRNANRWLVQLNSINDEKLGVQVVMPYTAPVGIWKLKISTKKVNSTKINTYTIREDLYVIFNPWHPQDSVFLNREDAREEYVLNEQGKIYIGSYNHPNSRVWNYGQFHAAVLPTMMTLLDKSRIDVFGRSDAVRVSRTVSAMMNSHDDLGLLVGNWSGSYGDGAAPWQWTGSPPIFQQYHSTDKPVKFAQCWVFGGVLTTALRTLGIPARTITNFMSAHDTDSSLTVDKFFSTSGEELKNRVNGDSIWNFHVWTDAWMARPDLPPGFGGWQAVDSTPQERSDHSYQLGPASLEAVKQGRIDYAYDVGFVFSEVNANLIHWHHNGGYKWRRSAIHTNQVGRLILTKSIGVITPFNSNDAEDITHQYKYDEFSKEERESYQRAINIGNLVRMFDD